MKKTSLDPAGHLSLAVSNFGKSKMFYKSLFDCLGFKQIRDKKDSVAWVTKEGFGIWIQKAKYTKPFYKHFAPGLHHLCVKAKTKKVVDEVYKNMATKKMIVLGKPMARPQYTPSYYNVLLIDPDGVEIEVAYY